MTESTAMAASASTTQSSTPLADLPAPLVLVGAGKMGGAMLEGWLALGLAPKKVVVIEPQPSPAIDGAGRARRAPQSAAATASARSPRSSSRSSRRSRPTSCRRSPPLVGANDRGASRSWRAGRCASCEAALPDAAIVRAMPNTPAAIGRGITVAVANARVTREQRDLAHTLCSPPPARSNGSPTKR